MKTLVWIGDQHIPDHDVKSNAAVFKYLADFKPDRLILGGDLMDMTCLGAMARSQLRKVEGLRVQKEFDAGNKYLDDLQRVLPAKTQVDYIQGNHEERVERWLEEHPWLEGVLDIPNALKLEKRKIKWTASWSKTKAIQVGKALFIHGLYHGRNHAETMVKGFGANVFYGHLHDTNSFNNITLGDNTTKVGQSLGCLCNYKAYYLKGRPTNWQQAFGVFFFRDDGFFQHYVVRIFNHQFVSPNGELYKP